MRSRERFISAISNKTPDRVPCTPDISNYIPCKQTGMPFWEIYFYKKYPLWEAYMDAADYFGIEHWVAASLEIPFICEDSKVEVKKEFTYDDSKDAMIATYHYNTPDGTLEERQICYRNEPPAHISRIIKDPTEDWKKYRWLLKPPTSLDEKMVDNVRQRCLLSNQAFGFTLGYPGFHMWEGFIEGGIETLSYALFDNPQFLQQWYEADLEIGTRYMELLLKQKPDYLLFGGSGTLTMSSPDIIKQYTIPALQKWSKMAKEAKVPTMLHSCGKSRLLVDMIVEYTDIDCINPLEIPPMGDVDLKEVKQAYGKEIALMGNLHTTDVMLYGSADDVYQAAKEAIMVAKEGGGFILSTGDQCPIDTPNENLFAMVAAAKEFGRY